MQSFISQWKNFDILAMIRCFSATGDNSWRVSKIHNFALLLSLSLFLSAMRFSKSVYNPLVSILKSSWLILIHYCVYFIESRRQAVRLFVEHLAPTLFSISMARVGVGRAIHRRQNHWKKACFAHTNTHSHTSKRLKFNSTPLPKIPTSQSNNNCMKKNLTKLPIFSCCIVFYLQFLSLSLLLSIYFARE